MSEAEHLLRANTYSGRPSGSAGFIESAERTLARRLTPSIGGRPRKAEEETNATAAGV
jgi:hypothetical protein